METLSSFEEDLLSNLILGVILVVLVALRDLCKRISQSDCEFGEHGLRIKLPTFRDPPTVAPVGRGVGAERGAVGEGANTSETQAAGPRATP